jgi:hypothetical protein
MSIVHRDGSEVSRDPRTGYLLAELILQSKGGGLMAALASYSSPWPLGTFLPGVSFVLFVCDVS